MSKKTAPKTPKRKKDIFFLLLCLGVFSLLLLALVNLRSYFLSKQVLGATTNTALIENEKLTKQQYHWETFLQTNPGYLEGWMELNRIYLALGKWDKASEALNKALQINPNTQILNGK